MLEQCNMEVEVHVVSTLVKIVLLAVLLVEMVVAAGPCRMWALDTANTFRKRRINMLDAAVTSPTSAAGGTSPA